jgi:hypothetical protein
MLCGRSQHFFRRRQQVGISATRDVLKQQAHLETRRFNACGRQDYLSTAPVFSERLH